VVDKSVKLSTSSFRDIPICELCLEDALKAGAAKSEKLKPQDFRETSIRFCIDGLCSWLKSFAVNRGETTLFAMTRDLSWYWASFCSTDETMLGLVVEYYSLLRDLTEKTALTDLVAQLDEPLRVKEVGYGGRPLNIVVPRAAWGSIQECATALGASASIFYQLGMAKALTSNSLELYSSWSAERFVPLFGEFMQRAKDRLVRLKRIRRHMEVDLGDDG